MIDGCVIDNAVLMFSAVNDEDYSALESLRAISARLRAMGVGLHLSEVKGRVVDLLTRWRLIEELNRTVRPFSSRTMPGLPPVSQPRAGAE